MIEFGRDVCGNLNRAETREWLVTNGIGGFASGTIAGVMTRRYHGLLIAALNPPNGRMYLVSKLDETAVYADNKYPLYTDRWKGGVIDPIGYQYIERFHLEGSTPVWTYAFADALLEKRIWMQQGMNSTYVQYTMRRGSAPLTLSVNALINYRKIHDETSANDWEMQVESIEHGLKITAYAGATPIYILSSQPDIKEMHDWYRHYFMMREANRGYHATEDHLNAAQLRLTLSPGQSATVVLSTEATPNLNGTVTYQQLQTNEEALVAQAPLNCENNACGNIINHLIVAANQFIVRRPVPGDPNGYAIMTGYHWFAHSIRDTILAIPGLLLSTGRADIASQLLRKHAFIINQGLLPDKYPYDNTPATYTSPDATLWYIEAIRAYHATSGNDQFVRELFPLLQDIIGWLQQGTHHTIHTDPEDGLLCTNEVATPLTWMNAVADNRPVTIRSGKPVEINALWYNALCTMTFFADMLGGNSSRYKEMAKKVRAGYGRYWNDETDSCYDVLDTPDGNDAKLRPNQIIAVSLPYSPLSAEKQKRIVDVVAQHLLTSHGLRTLSPHDPSYIGQYGGDSRQREFAYHQGTVWGGVIGPFVQAHLKVYGDKAQAYSYLLPLCNQLLTHGVGTMSEVFDGNPPFTPRGCIARAWTVASILHACHVIVNTPTLS